jgi:hypothetical protein
MIKMFKKIGLILIAIFMIVSTSMGVYSLDPIIPPNCTFYNVTAHYDVDTNTKYNMTQEEYNDFKDIYSHFGHKKLNEYFKLHSDLWVEIFNNAGNFEYTHNETSYDKYYNPVNVTYYNVSLTIHNKSF